jgi:polyhydroxyalkanoate synthesis repressor PhaR
VIPPETDPNQTATTGPEVPADAYATPHAASPAGAGNADGQVLEALAAEGDHDANGAAHTRRVIKRYSNRKLYDTKQSSYVTLLQIAELVRAGEDVQIVDNATKEDKTDLTLALIISEELKARPRAIPLTTLRALIRMRGGQLLTQLREGPIGRLMPRDETEEAPVESEEGAMTKDNVFRRTLEQWQHTIDERIRSMVSQFSAVQELQTELRRLSERVQELEKRQPPQG